MNEVKAILTLRNGKEIEQRVSKLVEKANREKEMESYQIIIKEDLMKKSMPPPFPQALKGKMKASKKVEILEFLRQVEVNIPLLDMIK